MFDITLVCFVKLQLRSAGSIKNSQNETHFSHGQTKWFVLLAKLCAFVTSLEHPLEENWHRIPWSKTGLELTFGLDSS